MSFARILFALLSIAVAAGFVYLWKLVTDAELIAPVFLPTPEATWAALRGGLADRTLGYEWLATVERMIYGWLSASLLGICIGALIGVSPRARAYLQPTLEFLRPLPASALVPLAVALLGLTEGMVLAVVAFGALWPMLLATVQGFASVNERLVEVSRMLDLSRPAFIFKIAFPNSMPNIFAGLRLGITIALILTVVGEMLTSRPGLGSSILLAARSFQAPQLFAGVVLLGITGYVSAIVLSTIEDRLVGWRKLA